MSTNDDSYPGYVPLTPTQQAVSDGLAARRWTAYSEQQWYRTHYNVARAGALSEAQAVDALARLATLAAQDRHAGAVTRARLGGK